MSIPNVPAFIHVMSTRDSARSLLIAKATSSVDNAKNRMQLRFLDVALNQVKIIIYIVTKFKEFYRFYFHFLLEQRIVVDSQKCDDTEKTKKCKKLKKKKKCKKKKVWKKCLKTCDKCDGSGTYLDT